MAAKKHTELAELAESTADAVGESETPQPSSKRFRKDKPWDTDDINHVSLATSISTSPPYARH